MNAHEALARLAPVALPGAVTEPVIVDLPDHLLRLATERHALSWLSQALGAGMIANATPEFSDAVRAAHLDAVRVTMAAHAATVLTVARLRNAGWTDVLVLKGCATGHLDHAHPTDRYSSDVDLLVSTGDQALLARVFGAGAVPVPRRRGWQARYGKSTTILDDNGIELDLHLTLSDGYFGLVVPPDELRRHVERFEMAGIELAAFDGPGRLLHAAIHAGSSHVNLNSARDVLQLLVVTGVDWRAAVDRATRWNVESLMALGVRRVFDAFVVAPHPILEWAQRHRASGRQRLALALAGDRPRGPLLTAPLALPVKRWPGYVAPLLFPSREYLAANNLQPGARAKRLLVEVATLIRHR